MNDLAKNWKVYKTFALFLLPMTACFHSFRIIFVPNTKNVAKLTFAFARYLYTLSANFLLFSFKSEIWCLKREDCGRKIVFVIAIVLFFPHFRYSFSLRFSIKVRVLRKQSPSYKMSLPNQPSLCAPFLVERG